MRTWWLVALCGCDSLFDLKVVPPPDGPPACYSSRQFGQICRTVTANDIEDTYLAAGKPTTPLGGRDALLVTATDPGLLKFDVSMIMPSERIADAQLVATPAGQADNCTNGTGSCPYCPIMVTQWQLAWVTTDWSSATATYDTRDGVTPWQDSDRGPIVTTGAPPSEPTASDPLAMEASSDQILAQGLTTPECWIENATLGIQVTVGESFGISSRFHRSPPAGCDGYPSPSLMLKLCSD